MSYNNKNNSGYRPNYNNRNNGFNNNYKRYDNRPTNDKMETISLVKFKKKNILIEDMNGKKYIISGNFPSEFLAEMSRVADKYIEYKKIMESEKPDPSVFAEMFEMMKDWCLKLINMNIYGNVYTMADINSGFNDLDALILVYDFIVKKTTATSQSAHTFTQDE